MGPLMLQQLYGTLIFVFYDLVTVKFTWAPYTIFIYNLFMSFKKIKLSFLTKVEENGVNQYSQQQKHAIVKSHLHQPSWPTTMFEIA